MYFDKLLCVFCITLFNILPLTEGNCSVNNLPIQPNFDLDKYVGKWYEYQWHTKIYYQPEDRYNDYYHYYVQTTSGNITNYINGRDPTAPDGKCFFVNFNLYPTNSPGKLIYTSQKGEFPYWVLETDYTQYAFVYGCYNVSNDGTCNEAQSWIWSRTPKFPQIIKDKAPSWYNLTCLPASTFLDTKQEKECNVPAQYKITPDQSCQVSDVPIQPDFNITLFNGTWYEMQWLAQVYIPASELFQDYQHEYILQEDGSLKGYIRGRTDKGCFYRQASLTLSGTPGKLHFNVTEGGSDNYPYWIVDTDYNNYAVMYGCLNVSTSGNCTRARSTVWSRRKSLAPNFQYRANSFLQNLCVNPAAFLLTSQNNPCDPCYKQPCGKEISGGTTSISDYQLILLALVIFLSI
ncbi:uncharacterized protein LOC124272882 [Haliotis rubra]|uniref:uncharacterized protein LOC124272882 n=1 Tax=Haliotis rubra TaxID=36100 RepID=UPI001EE5DC5D|nr:uncharacterized protein LOC124272882 [Haliotis rubra]